jgi:IS5 family transposase
LYCIWETVFLITRYIVTSAEVHDSQATDALLDERDKGEPFYADSAYTGEPQEKIIAVKVI